MECSVFRPFGESIVVNALAEGLTFSLDDVPHPLCLLAANKLQLHLQHEREWEHNFGLSSGEGAVIGKMFGVLVVRTQSGELGYIAAFSGKLAGGNHHPEFVPPVFDGLVEGGFVNAGMRELTRINEEISTLASLNDQVYINQLKIKRKNHSVALQQRIFEQYHFLNKAGSQKV
jgi:tRNA pseudouridine32 synthase/23S rRNA pseudouridine746 synthase